MDSLTHPLHLFEKYGIELEYMIVDEETLSVLPLADRILYEVSGEYATEVEMGELAWSNELVSHLIELKTNGPVSSLEPLPEVFNHHIAQVNYQLSSLNACLMPSAMHPWMNPLKETQLWSHEYNLIYQTFNRIFGCRSHGWANLQSVHINLPFADDEEFARLHAAIRILLPIMPALSASSPIIEGRFTGMLDYRLEVYRNNAKMIPSISGRVIPEPVFNQEDYENKILKKMYHDISPYDPEGILQFEWLNARGAIARFDRNTIEIRVLDVQECPLADLAIASAIISVLKALVAEQWTDFKKQKSWDVQSLEPILLDTIKNADQTVISNPYYLELFRFPNIQKCTAGELWQHLIETLIFKSLTPLWKEPLSVILEKGTLSRRIIKTLGHEITSEKLSMVYRQLCHCLVNGKMFLG